MDGHGSAHAPRDGGARADGSNLSLRLMRDGHTCVVYDVAPAAVGALVTEGATGANSLEELVAALPVPRTVWLMLPAGEITERALTDVAQLLEPGDAVIDGGNTHYVDDLSRGAALEPLGIHYLDVGVSGRRVRARSRASA